MTPFAVRIALPVHEPGWWQGLWRQVPNVVRSIRSRPERRQYSLDHAPDFMVAELIYGAQSLHKFDYEARAAGVWARLALNVNPVARTACAEGLRRELEDKADG